MKVLHNKGSAGNLFSTYGTESALNHSFFAKIDVVEALDDA